MPVIDFVEPQVEQGQQTYIFTFQKKAEEICNENSPPLLDFEEHCMNNAHECPIEKRAEEIRDTAVKVIVIYSSVLSCDASLREKRRGHLEQSFRFRRPGRQV